MRRLGRQRVGGDFRAGHAAETHHAESGAHRVEHLASRHRFPYSIHSNSLEFSSTRAYSFQPLLAAKRQPQLQFLGRWAGG